MLAHMGVTRENLSSGFPKKMLDSNQTAQLQKLARKLKISSYEVYNGSLD